eukprot:7379800-Prymnesium_polylepis.1
MWIAASNRRLLSASNSAALGRSGVDSVGASVKDDMGMQHFISTMRDPNSESRTMRDPNSAKVAHKMPKETKRLPRQARNGVLGAGDRYRRLAGGHFTRAESRADGVHHVGPVRRPAGSLRGERQVERQPVRRGLVAASVPSGDHRGQAGQ